MCSIPNPIFTQNVPNAIYTPKSIWIPIKVNACMIKHIVNAIRSGNNSGLNKSTISIQIVFFEQNMCRICDNYSLNTVQFVKKMKKTWNK